VAPQLSGVIKGGPDAAALHGSARRVRKQVEKEVEGFTALRAKYSGSRQSRMMESDEWN